MLRTSAWVKDISRIWMEHNPGICTKPQSTAKAAAASEEGSRSSEPTTR